MNINKRLIRKMIKRIETMPETYSQATFGTKDIAGDRDIRDISERPAPVCGTVACLAGEAIICTERDPVIGVKKLFDLMGADGNEPEQTAAQVMGLTTESADVIFWSSSDWPEPFCSQHQEAHDYRAEALAATNLLKAIIATNGEVLRSGEQP